MSEKIVARMWISHVARYNYGPPGVRAITHLDVSAHAVYSPDPNAPNYSFSQATPNATLRMTITNPDAFKFFEEGKEIDIAMSAAPEK